MNARVPAACRSRDACLERARIEAAVRRGKEEWEGTADALPELIFLVEPPGRVLRCNRAAALFLRRGFDALLGQDLQALFAGHEPRDVAALSEGRGDVVCQAPFTVLSVSRHPVACSDAPGRVVYVMRDVTELRRLESLAANVELLDNLGHVLAVVRHEVGNPVNAVKTALTVLLERFELFDAEKKRGYVRRCLDDVARVQELLEQLRGFTLFEDIAPAPFDVTAFLRGLDSWLRAALANERVRFVLRVPAGQPVAAVGDPRALRQVLLGLVANAKDALGGRAAARIEVALEAGPADVRVAVRDNGRGVAPDDLPRVFLPFFTTKTRGTGLGLAVARTMVTRMRGTIDLHSRMGHGTCVAITLQRVSADQPGAGRAPAGD